MDPLKFRPALTALEDRTTPTVTPEQVVAAAQNTQLVGESLAYIGQNLGLPRTQQEIQEVARYATGLVVVSRENSRVLSEYSTGLQAELAANPGLNATIGDFFTRVETIRGEANTHIQLARIVAIGFGTPPTVIDGVPPSPPSPPSPPGPTPPLPPFNPTDNSGMTDTFPDPNSPNFVDIGGGLKSWDVAVGEGTPVPVGGNVRVFYTGWLASNGTQFETNRNGTPLSSPLSGLIVGWQEGVPGMKPGGIRRLYIPFAKAYGVAGSPPNIPGSADLIFEIKLLSPTP